MKLRILSIFLLMQGNFMIAQEKYEMDYEIIYEVEYSMDSTDLENKSIENVYLFSNSKQSVFMSYSKAFENEIKEKIQQQIKTQRKISFREEYTTNFSRIFYKNLQTGKVKSLDNIETKNYIFDEPNFPLEWKIDPETKEIFGYSTQKAQTYFAGRNYTARFTTEIPLSDGPYLFSGLPGLIVELYDEEDHYHFTLKEIKKLEEKKLLDFPKGEEIDKPEFLKLQQKAKENSQNNEISLPGIQMKIVSTDGMSQEQKADNQAAKRRIKKNKSKKNNPIELKL